MIVPSPYLANSQLESLGAIPLPSSPRNSHDLVVCKSCILFKDTDTTLGFPARQCLLVFEHIISKRLRRQQKYMLIIFLLASSSASSSSNIAAKPLMCLLYE